MPRPMANGYGYGFHRHGVCTASRCDDDEIEKKKTHLCYLLVATCASCCFVNLFRTAPSSKEAKQRERIADQLARTHACGRYPRTHADRCSNRQRYMPCSHPHSARYVHSISPCGAKKIQPMIFCCSQRHPSRLCISCFRSCSDKRDFISDGNRI